MLKKMLALLTATALCCGAQALTDQSLLLHLKLDEGGGTVAKGAFWF